VADSDPSGEDPDMAAAELALGVLDGPERAEALRRMLADPAFAREVDGWRERLAPLIDEIAAVSPPDSLWPRIAGALDRTGDTAPLERRVARWRGLAVGASALAAVLLGWIAIDLRRPPETVFVERPVLPAAPTRVAQLAAADAGPMAIAAVTADGALKISPWPMAGGGKSAELWVIPAGGKPVSLGLVQPGHVNTLTISAELRPLLDGAATLAISIEPAGGSPTGQPTGPVVATGRMTSI